MRSHSKPLRILLATEYLPPFISGIANRCKNWIKHLEKEGHQVSVYSVYGAPLTTHSVPSIPNVFYNKQRMFMLPPLKLVCELLNPFEAVPYDIIHVVAPLCLPFIFLLPLFYMRGVPIYVSYHVYLQYYKHYYFSGYLAWFGIVAEIFLLIFYVGPMVLFANVVGVPSKTADTHILRWSRRVHYLKSGLDTDVFAPLEDEGTDVLPVNPRPVLCYVGRLAKEKQVDFLIECLALSQLEHVALVIVGDGPEKKTLYQLACDIVGTSNVYQHDFMDMAHILPSSTHAGEAQPSNMFQLLESYRIVFTGMMHSEKAIAEMYARSDVFVSASASETFGFTVAEALACGTPAVVVRQGAFKTVYHMMDEWLFEEGNKEDVAHKINSVLQAGHLESSARGKRTSEAIRKRCRQVAVNHFSIESSVKDLLHIYNECIDN